MHKCDNRPCINIDHLILGTKALNAYDRNAKGRQSKGEGRPTAKLKEHQVLEIRALASSGLTQKEIGERYGIKRNTISQILSGALWKHI